MKAQIRIQTAIATGRIEEDKSRKRESMKER